MNYSVAIALPANTAEADPVITYLALASGIVSHIEIDFPAGCKGLAHLQIRRYERQLWPLTPGQSYAGNKYAIAFDERFPILEDPYQVKIIGWNLDTRYEHTVTVRITVMGQSDLSTDAATHELSTMLSTAFGLPGPTAQGS